jgi:hypothetical protein
MNKAVRLHLQQSQWQLLGHLFRSSIGILRGQAQQPREPRVDNHYTRSQHLTHLPTDLPDSFFEPSVLELKAAFASQQKLREELNNAPLKSKAIREKEENAKLSKWPTVRSSDLTRLILIRVVHNTSQVPGPVSIGDYLPLDGQDQIGIRLCQEFATRRRQAYQIHPMYVIPSPYVSCR